jgi:hypothetical protein
VTTTPPAPADKRPFREPDPLAPLPAGSTWFELQLVDELGRPIGGERFEIELADRTLAAGTTGPGGTARLRGIPPGTCRVSLPRLDGALWEPA